jgi:hypothetical protein
MTGLTKAYEFFLGTQDFNSQLAESLLELVIDQGFSVDFSETCLLETGIFLCKSIPWIII